MDHALVLSLAAKQDISEMLWRYSRAVDRHDMDLLRSVYWPEAADNHGAYNGNASGFVDFLFEAMAPDSAFRQSHHMISNILIELDGERAHVESYYQSFHRLEDTSGEYDEIVGGRYIDLFERRGREWRILDRRCLYDWARREAGTERFWERWPGAFLHGVRDRSDEVYRVANGPDRA